MNRDDTIIRVPPQSVEAEQAVLGGLMLAPEALPLVMGVLSDEDFYRRDHQLIYRAIRELAENNKPYDAVTLGEWFESMGLAEQVSNGAYLIELASTTPSAANIEAYARIVRDKSALRAQIDAGTEIVNSAFLANGNASEIYADNVHRLVALWPRVSTESNDPLDLFCDQPPPRLRAEYLPPVIAKFAFDYAEVMGTAPEIIAMTALSTAASAIHDGFVLQPKPEEPRWQERACLWMMIVAEPGSKKTPAQKLALAPLIEIDRDLAQRYAGQFAEYQQTERIAKLAQKEVDKRKAKALTGETTGLDEALDMPDRPQQSRIFISDATIEKAAELMADNPRGMTFYRDELSGWFGSMDAYSKGGAPKDRPKWLEAYNGGHQVIDRIGRGTSFVPNWSMSVVGSIQPDKIKALVYNSQDDGLFQRFIVVDIPNAYRPEQERSPDREAYSAYCDAIRRLWQRSPGPDGHCLVQLDEAAHGLRKAFFEWVGRVSSTDGLPSMLRGHLSKWTGLWCRLVLTYHCFGCATAGKFPSAVPVSAATVVRVNGLMQKYLLPQAMRFYSDTASASDTAFSAAKQVAALVLAGGVTRLTARDMQQNCKVWREGQEWQRAAIVNLLSESGWLLSADTKRRRSGGETAWTVNPRVHSLYADRATLEKIRRAAVSEGLRELQEAARAQT